MEARYADFLWLTDTHLLFGVDLVGVQVSHDAVDTERPSKAQ